MCGNLVHTKPTGFAFMVHDIDSAWKRKSWEEAGSQGEKKLSGSFPGTRGTHMGSQATILVEGESK